jgi:hypothetical protein
VGGDLRDLEACQKAVALAARVIRVARRFRSPAARVIAGQLVRAAASIPLARAGGWQSDEDAEALLASTREVRAMLSGLLRRVSPATSS